MAIDALVFDHKFNPMDVKDMDLKQIIFWLERASKHRKARGY